MRVIDEVQQAPYALDRVMSYQVLFGVFNTEQEYGGR